MRWAESSRVALHDDAYRYAFRRSRSHRLASAAALAAVRELDTQAEDGGADESVRSQAGAATDDRGVRRTIALAAARRSLEQFIPPTLPPRVEGDPDLQDVLVSLSPGDRELLLLHRWDGLSIEHAGLVAGREAVVLPDIEKYCARRLALSPNVAGAFAVVLSAADPAGRISAEDLARSQRRLVSASGPLDGSGAPAVAPQQVPVQPLPPTGPADPRGRRIQAIVGTACLLALVLAIAAVFLPRSPADPSSATARLFELADVVAVVSSTTVEPTVVDGEMRILQEASVVQIVKGEAPSDAVTIDVTGRSTLERPYSRDYFPPNQLIFLVRDEDGVLAPIEGEGSVLTLVNRRSPAATTTTGDPVPLPDALRNAISALPANELRVATSGAAPGSLGPEEIVGIRPAEGRDSQNLPQDLLGTFHGSTEGPDACVWFEFGERSVLIRWPDGFSAYQRPQTMAFPDGDPNVEELILTVLNERGYPYVDENRSAPFIRGVATGDRASCGGQEFDVWDIAVAPGSTLLFY